MCWRQILTVRASCFHSFSSTVWSLAFRAEAFPFVPSVVLVSAGHPQCGRCYKWPPHRSTDAAERPHKPFPLAHLPLYIVHCTLDFIHHHKMVLFPVYDAGQRCFGQLFKRNMHADGAEADAFGGGADAEHTHPLASDKALLPERLQRVALAIVLGHHP